MLDPSGSAQYFDGSTVRSVLFPCHQVLFLSPCHHNVRAVFYHHVLLKFVDQMINGALVYWHALGLPMF